MEDLKNKVTTYFKGVKTEWGKIVWPDKNQIKFDLLWVVGVSTLFTLLIFGLDKLFEWLLKGLQ